MKASVNKTQKTLDANVNVTQKMFNFIVNFTQRTYNVFFNAHEDVLLVKVAFEDDAILSFEDNYEVIYE